MVQKELLNALEVCPIIATVHDDGLTEALKSPCKIIFYLKSNIITVRDKVSAVHNVNKKIVIHLDLADWIGKDKAGIEYLKTIGVDGLISTRTQLIRWAKEIGLLTVQRFFTLDSQGVESITDVLKNYSPDMIEIMPGVISKTISVFSKSQIPVIAGGLIETKSEVTNGLLNGATAISTGKKELWYI